MSSGDRLLRQPRPCSHAMTSRAPRRRADSTQPRIIDSDASAVRVSSSGVVVTSTGSDMSPSLGLRSSLGMVHLYPGKYSTGACGWSAAESRVLSTLRDYAPCSRLLLFPQCPVGFCSIALLWPVSGRCTSRTGPVSSRNLAVAGRVRCAARHATVAVLSPQVPLCTLVPPAPDAPRADGLRRDKCGTLTLTSHIRRHERAAVYRHKAQRWRPQ